MGVRPRAAARGLIPLVLSAAFIAFFTLRPVAGESTGLRPGGYILTDLVLNVILFAPLGISLALARASPRGAAIVGLIASTAIELAQLWWIPGRFSSPLDVATNTAGAWLGALIVAHWDQRARIWRIVGPGAAVLIVLTWVGGAFLFTPSPPPPVGSYAQWAHEIGNYGTFSGRVLALRIQGIPLPEGWIQGTRALHDALAEADTIRLQTAVITGSPSPGISQVTSVVSGRRFEIVGVWQDGAALIARHRLGLTDAGLRTPWIRLDGALPPTPGDTVLITFEVDRRAMRLTAAHAGQTSGAEMRLSPDLFWSAFLPFDWQGGTGTRWWQFLPALLAYVILGMALGRHLYLLGLATAVTIFGGPLLGAGAFPDLAALVIAGLGPPMGVLLGGRLALQRHEGPPLSGSGPSGSDT